MRIGFFGAAGEVTGSSYLVETGKTRFLVDCGMFQGGPEAYAKNIAALNFGFDVRQIDFVLLTHAHIDHSGLLPRLGVLGYRGPIYTTPATADLLEVLLPDSAHIQEKESEWQLRHQHRKGKGDRPRVTPPLYTVAQATSALEQLDAVPLGEWLQPAEGIRVRFHEAGHILGSAWIEVLINEAGNSAGSSSRAILAYPVAPSCATRKHRTQKRTSSSSNQLTATANTARWKRPKMKSSPLSNACIPCAATSSFPPLPSAARRKSSTSSPTSSAANASGR